MGGVCVCVWCCRQLCPPSLSMFCRTELISLFAVFVPMAMTEFLPGRMGSQKLSMAIACEQTRHHRQPCGGDDASAPNLHGRSCQKTKSKVSGFAHFPVPSLSCSAVEWWL
ncbi:hypothetical protein V8C34DRAFT_289161 [Trichoderma compactum]